MSNYLNNFDTPKDGEKIESILIDNFELLQSVSKIRDCLNACPNVNRLAIRLYDVQKDKAANSSMEGVISTIAIYGKNIESLQLQSPTLEDNDLKYLSNNNLPKLRRLAIPRSRKIGPEGIEYVSSQCPELTSLDLHYSLYGVTDEAAKFIGMYLPKLKYINLHRTCHLTDSGLTKIVEGCNELEIIEVGRNYRLTDYALKKISENCPKLITLAMYYNKEITEKGFQYIVDGCPKFKNFYDGNGFGAIPALREIKSKYSQINFS